MSESPDWEFASLDAAIFVMNNEVRTLLTSVKGWAEIISTLPETKSVEVVSGLPLEDGMAGLLHQMQELQSRLDTFVEYAVASRIERDS